MNIDFVKPCNIGQLLQSAATTNKEVEDKLSAEVKIAKQNQDSRGWEHLETAMIYKRRRPNNDES